MNVFQELAIKALEAVKGDDTNRARRAFAGMSPEQMAEQMAEQYGESGRTRAEILAECERTDAEIDEAIAWVRAAELPSPPSIATDLQVPPPGAVEGAEIELYAPDFRGFVTAWRHRIEGERIGQAAFNLLRELHPDLAERVRGVEGLDPFHIDKNLPMFWAWLAQILDGKP